MNAQTDPQEATQTRSSSSNIQVAVVTSSRRLNKNKATMVSLQHGFPFLVGAAFCIAVLGLAGNFLHLQSLMSTEAEFEDMTHHFLPALTKTQRHMSENQVFQRMLRESIASLEDCQQLETHNIPNLQDAWMANRSQRLPRFGFMNALTNYLAVPSAVDTRQCHYPPETSCQVPSYSIFTTSTGENLRSLFLNCMGWLTHAGVATLQVVLPKNTKDLVAQDAKYGQRLLSWDSDDTHKVQLVWVDTLWDALTNLTQLSEAVLFMNADIDWEGTTRGIEAGFELWKRHSDSVVVSHGWHLEVAEQRRLDDDIGNDTIVSKEIHSVCKNQRVVTTVQSDIELMALSGAFVHRSLLCFVSHPVLKPYRQFTTNLQEARIALSILLSQLSGHSQRLFPAIVRGPGEGRRKQMRKAQSILQLQESGSKIPLAASGLNETESTKQTDARDDATPDDNALTNGVVTIAGKAGALVPKMTKSKVYTTSKNGQLVPEKIKISDSKALRGATDTMPSTTATNKNIAKTLAESTFPLSHAVVGTNNQEIAIQPHTKKRSLANRKREAIPGQSHASLPETSVTRNDPTAQSIPIPSKHRRLQDMSSIQVLDDNFMSAIIGYFGSMSFGSVSWCESGCSILEDALASEVTWIEETCGDFERNT